MDNFYSLYLDSLAAIQQLKQSLRFTGEDITLI